MNRSPPREVPQVHGPDDPFGVSGPSFTAKGNQLKVIVDAQPPRARSFRDEAIRYGPR